MNLRFLKSMTVCLMLMSFTSLAKAQVTLQPTEAHNLAEQLKQGEICKGDLALTKSAYEGCKSLHNPVQFWQTPGFLIGDFVVGFSTGAILCATHLFGICK